MKNPGTPETYTTAMHADDRFTFAHLSDPHLSSLDSVRSHELASKRILGYLSWRHRRRHEHRIETLDALVADLRAHHPDHVVVTGDLTHLGLPAEYAAARAWLDRLGHPDAVSVVPGNHDCYVRGRWADGLAHWAPWFASDGMDAPSGEADAFPMRRVRACVAFFGISTAVPSAPFFATGRVGARQLDRIEEQLMEAGRAGLFRVVLLHHPPVPGSERWRKRLVDATALSRVIGRVGAELVLHGHTHRAVQSRLHGPRGEIPVIGMPSASALTDRPGRAAQYLLCEVMRRERGFALRLHARRLVVTRGVFESAGQVTEFVFV